MELGRRGRGGGRQVPKLFLINEGYPQFFSVSKIIPVSHCIQCKQAIGKSCGAGKVVGQAGTQIISIIEELGAKTA